MAFDIIRHTLAATVANAGTFTVGYPTNRDDGDYAGGFDHQVVSNTYGPLKATLGEISVSFDASVVTITNSSGGALAAGTEVYVQLDRAGANTYFESVLADPNKMAFGEVVVINLGAPITADPNGVGESQSVTASVAGLLNGALVSGGVAVFDAPRNVVAAWTNAAVITVTGTDAYGDVIVESSGSGTSLAGKKAFKTVTGFTFSANVTGATVGTGDVLGIPVFLPQTGRVIAQLQDGAPATAGTLVAGVSTAATATTGDVRGTYDPNSACNGALDFQLIAVLDDSSYTGVAQFAG